MPATPKGRTKKPRGGTRSTRQEKKDEFEKELEKQMKLDEDMHPAAGSTASEGAPTNKNVFCFAALAEKEKGTVYTDATGVLPVMPLGGHQYYIVAYDYDNNFIETKEVSDLKDETIVETVQKIFDEMEENDHRPLLNVTDNQAAQPLKAFLKTKEYKWQFVESHNHRVNAAERAIQTFKSHLISGFCCTDSEWPLKLWNSLTKQALITLNLCRMSRKHPDKLAYHSFYGRRYDWNKHPMAPPGTRAAVYESPVGRLLWGTRGVDGWYC